MVTFTVQGSLYYSLSHMSCRGDIIQECAITVTLRIVVLCYHFQMHPFFLMDRVASGALSTLERNIAPSPLLQDDLLFLSCPLYAGYKPQKPTFTRILPVDL
jgi:hypothetical protein